MTNTEIQSKKSEVLALVVDVERCIRQNEPYRAAHRMADAGGILREWLEGAGHRDLAGLDEPTGRGYMLPQPVAYVAEVPIA